MSKIKTCPYCKATIHADEVNCPACGAVVTVMQKGDLLNKIEDAQHAVKYGNVLLVINFILAAFSLRSSYIVRRSLGISPTILFDDCLLWLIIAVILIVIIERNKGKLAKYTQQLKLSDNEGANNDLP